METKNTAPVSVDPSKNAPTADLKNNTQPSTPTQMSQQQLDMLSDAFQKMTPEERVKILEQMGSVNTLSNQQNFTSMDVKKLAKLKLDAKLKALKERRTGVTKKEPTENAKEEESVKDDKKSEQLGTAVNSKLKGALLRRQQKNKKRREKKKATKSQPQDSNNKDTPIVISDDKEDAVNDDSAMNAFVKQKNEMQIGSAPVSVDKPVVK